MGVDIDLNEHTAIVTGAGKGIGRAIAYRFADAGVNVVAAARTESEIEETIKEIEDRGAEGLAVPGNLAEVPQIHTLVDATLDRFGIPDILVNNAGVFLTSHPLDQDLADVDAMFDLNLRTPFILSQRFGQEFRNSDLEYGRIINIASNVTKVVVPSWTAYSATKAGIVALTRHFAIAMAEDGVTANSVSPGTTRTPAVERVIEERGEEIYNFDGLPFGRIAEPKQIADTCLFLASPLSNYITGEEIQVDGGVRLTSQWYK
jgi:NAD(P)-dependent dehydrogenase (short-subunit alcohol dehydrogenase family)